MARDGSRLEVLGLFYLHVNNTGWVRGEETGVDAGKDNLTEVSTDQGVAEMTSNPAGPSRSAIILAGGMSSRFGVNKAFQTLAGKPLICHVAERLSNVVDEVLVVVGRNAPTIEYSAILPDSVRVINDEVDGQTPLVGIVSGLRSVTSDHVAVLACDIPFVKDSVLELLFQRAINVDAAIPRWKGGRIEPLEAVYRRARTLLAGEEALAHGGLSQREMINRLTRVVYVSVEDEVAVVDNGLRTFFNVNSREDLAMAEKMIAGGCP